MQCCTPLHEPQGTLAALLHTPFKQQVAGQACCLLPRLPSTFGLLAHHAAVPQPSTACSLCSQQSWPSSSALACGSARRQPPAEATKVTVDFAHCMTVTGPPGSTEASLNSVACSQFSLAAIIGSCSEQSPQSLHPCCFHSICQSAPTPCLMLSGLYRAGALWSAPACCIHPIAPILGGAAPITVTHSAAGRPAPGC